MSLRVLLKLLICFIFLQVFCLNSNNLEASEIELVTSLAYKCSNLEEIKSCQNVLNRIQELKTRVVSTKDFACETRLLGLESKILMAFLNRSKFDQNFRTVEHFENACSSYK